MSEKREQVKHKQYKTKGAVIVKLQRMNCVVDGRSVVTDSLPQPQVEDTSEQVLEASQRENKPLISELLSRMNVIMSNYSVAATRCIIHHYPF